MTTAPVGRARLTSMAGAPTDIDTIATDRPQADLLDPAFYQADPHPTYTWMRANEPLYRDEPNGLWAVTRHADVFEVERNSATFVSGRGYRSWWSPEENNIIAQDDPGHLAQRRLVSSRFTPEPSGARRSGSTPPSRTCWRRSSPTAVRWTSSTTWPPSSRAG